MIVHFISKQDLIENKRQVGRLIDLADVERLELVPESTIVQLPADSDSEAGGSGRR